MLEEKARKFAFKSYEGQFRKDGKTPYIKHPEGVVDLLRYIDIKNEDIICAAWLHDVIEDCNITREYLQKGFVLDFMKDY